MARRSTYLKQIFSRILEFFRGPRSIREVELNGVLETCLTGITLRGVVINITCSQIVHECKYSRWWVRDRCLYTYKVSCTYEGEPPDKLVTAMSTTHYFPDILSKWSSHAAQREAAISAFLDILLSRLAGRGEKRIPLQF